jgi:hypothetical protein
LAYCIKEPAAGRCTGAGGGHEDRSGLRAQVFNVHISGRGLGVPGIPMAEMLR